MVTGKIQIPYVKAAIFSIIVHSRNYSILIGREAVQLIPNSTRQEYLLSFHGNSALEQPNAKNLNVLIGETGRKDTETEVTILWNDLFD